MRQYEMNLRDERRRKLRAVAAGLGCIAERGATAGDGSITQLNEDIADGKVVCVKREEWNAILRLFAVIGNPPAHISNVYNAYDAIPSVKAQYEKEE
jgi:hypothetical protein